MTVCEAWYFRELFKEIDISFVDFFIPPTSLKSHNTVQSQLSIQRPELLIDVLVRMLEDAI